MPDIKPEQLHFYLLGRDDAPTISTVDRRSVADILIKTGGDLRSLVHDRCAAAARGEGKRGIERLKSGFLEDNEQDLTDPAGEADFQAWLAGRADQLAVEVERDVLALLEEHAEDDEDADEDADEDEDSEGLDDEDEDDDAP